MKIVENRNSIKFKILKRGSNITTNTIHGNDIKSKSLENNLENSLTSTLNENDDSLIINDIKFNYSEVNKEHEGIFFNIAVDRSFL